MGKGQLRKVSIQCGLYVCTCVMIYFVAVPVRSLSLSDNRKSIEAEDLPTLTLAGELSM